MDDFDKDQVLRWYEWLEAELLEIIKYIPPADQNLQTFSPRLATLIIESCGLLDSIFRQVSPDPSVIDGKTTPRRKLDITDYAKLYADRFQLPTSRSILLNIPPRYLAPFSAWNGFLSGGAYQPLLWWQIHNELKHDRIAHLKKARLEVAIESLCGLQMVIATLPDFARSILSRNWVFCSGYNPQHVIEALEGKAHSEWLTFLVESNLFVVARGGAGKFPDNIDDFKPSQFKASERIVNFFGRWF